MASWFHSVWFILGFAIVGIVFGIAAGAFRQYFRTRRSRRDSGNQPKQ